MRKNFTHVKTGGPDLWIIVSSEYLVDDLGGGYGKRTMPKKIVESSQQSEQATKSPRQLDR